MNSDTRDPDVSVDARWMDVALTLARRGLGRTAPNPPVGAVLVSPEGHAVSRGWTQPGGRPHAERVALDAAGEAARGATLYVTLEPCSHFGKTPPCADAIIRAGVARVVVAMADPDPRVAGRGLMRLNHAGVAVTFGIGEDEAKRLAAGHVSRVTTSRPHVALKLAVSRDGKVAGEGGRTVAITGEASRVRVHMMRAEADAILVGVGTVLADDPELTCRLPGMADRSPIRVVLDGALRTPLSAKIVTSARETPSWIFCAMDAPEEREQALAAHGVEVLRVDRDDAGRLDLTKTLGRLAARGVTRLMVEGGPSVAAALLSQDLIDEATIVTGPAELGPAALDALAGRSLADLTGGVGLVQSVAFAVGDDRWTTYVRA